MNPKELVLSFSKAQVGVLLLCSSMAAVAGAAAGAKIAIDRLGAKLREEADEALQLEIKQTKEFYKRRNKGEEFSTPQEALKTLHPKAKLAEKNVLDGLIPGNIGEALQAYAGVSKDEAQNLVQVTQNVFTDVAYVREPFDYEKELLRRDPTRPYLITEDEFNEAGPGYEQLNFTYYAGDGVLANGEDEEIVSVEEAVGKENLMRFGDGTEDENLVHVRNVELEMDICIAQSPGKYSVEVAGFDDEDDEPETELRHSDRGVRKFRDRHD